LSFTATYTFSIGVYTGLQEFSEAYNNDDEHGDITFLWNQVIQADIEVLANRPDIIIENKKDKTFLLVDVAIPSDKNVIQKEAEKKLKYKNLSTEIQRMWNMKCFVMPVIIGATGIVSRCVECKSNARLQCRECSRNMHLHCFPKFHGLM
jgi:hypothetical protein